MKHFGGTPEGQQIIRIYLAMQLTAPENLDREQLITRAMEQTARVRYDFRYNHFKSELDAMIEDGHVAVVGGIYHIQYCGIQWHHKTLARMLEPERLRKTLKEDLAVRRWKLEHQGEPYEAGTA